MSSSPTDLAPVLARLDRLERQNRLLKRTGVVVLLLIAALLFWGETRRNDVQAAPGLSNNRALQGDKFMLQDDHGNNRAGLVMGKEGPALMFYDDHGKERAGLELSRNATALRFLGPTGKVQAGLSVETGGVAIGYYDETGRVHAGSDALKNVVGFSLSNEPPPPVTPARP